MSLKPKANVSRRAGKRRPAGPAPAAGPTPRKAGTEPLDHDEILSLVCEYFCQGKSPSEIAHVMRELHHVNLTREAPYRYLSVAAGHGMLRFVPRSQDVLSKRLTDLFGWLQADVVHCGSVESVADRAAERVRLFWELVVFWFVSALASCCLAWFTWSWAAARVALSGPLVSVVSLVWAASRFACARASWVFANVASAAWAW